jgi:hypothetical protein
MSFELHTVSTCSKMFQQEFEQEHTGKKSTNINLPPCMLYPVAQYFFSKSLSKSIEVKKSARTSSLPSCMLYPVAQNFFSKSLSESIMEKEQEHRDYNPVCSMLLLLTVLWSCRGLNPGPNKQQNCFLHAYPLVGISALNREKATLSAA